MKSIAEAARAVHNKLAYYADRPDLNREPVRAAAFALARRIVDEQFLAKEPYKYILVRVDIDQPPNRPPVVPGRFAPSLGVFVPVDPQYLPVLFSEADKNTDAWPVVQHRDDRLALLFVSYDAYTFWLASVCATGSLTPAMVMGAAAVSAT